MDIEKVRAQAKQIMDDFMAALGKVGDTHEEELPQQGETRQADKCELGAGFPERMLKNAPKTTDNFVVAERKKW